MKNERRTLRKKFNDVVRTGGNRVREGLGDTLTKEINLTNPLAITRAVMAPLTYAHVMCEGMYETGVVDRMYSPELAERMIGTIESCGYTLGWMIALPITAAFGALALGKIGERLDRI